MNLNRRNFIKNTVTSSAYLTVLSAFPNYLVAGSKSLSKVSRIKFSVIGLNHGHIICFKFVS